MRELQVSYDGCNDGKYGMVMDGHLIKFEEYEQEFMNKTTRSRSKATTSKNWRSEMRASRASSWRAARGLADRWEQAFEALLATI